MPRVAPLLTAITAAALRPSIATQASPLGCCCFPACRQHFFQQHQACPVAGPRTATLLLRRRPLPPHLPLPQSPQPLLPLRRLLLLWCPGYRQLPVRLLLLPGRERGRAGAQPSHARVDGMAGGGSLCDQAISVAGRGGIHHVVGHVRAQLNGAAPLTWEVLLENCKGTWGSLLALSTSNDKQEMHAKVTVSHMAVGLL